MQQFLSIMVLLAGLAAAPPASAQSPFPFFPFFQPRYQRETPPPPAREFLVPQRPAPPRLSVPTRRPPATPEETPRIEGAPPPYESDLARLAEILGALHYLHPLCGGNAPNRWRGEMDALIEAEQPGPVRRGRMIASFNRGYFTYEQTYRGCTEAATLVIGRFLNEGARLSREIATRYAY